MITLTVTAKGQITLSKEVLEHLGIKPHEKIKLDFLPDGRCSLKSAVSSGTIADFFGLLAGRTSKAATVEEIRAASEAGWAK